MLKKITMPPGGQTTDRLMIAKWRKEVGESVKRGDILLEVETDKAVLEVESFAEGTLLKRIGEEGEYATVGDVIALIGKPGELEAEAVAKPEIKSQSPQPDADYQPIIPVATSAISIEPVQTLPVEDTNLHSRLAMSPAAKKMIRDNALDMGTVYQSVGKPIVHKPDVESYLSQLRKDSTSVPEQPALAADSAFYRVPLTAMRRTIAARMLQSTTSIPSFSVEVEIEMTACTNLRKELNTYCQDTKISYNDIFAKCVARAVADFPLINASFEEAGIKVFKSVNIGLAVSLDQGLVVPVVHDVASKSLVDVARENATNVSSVRNGKYDTSLLENGTITISNLGTFPVTRFTAIINPPQVCILAIGSIRKVPCVVDGQLQEKSILSVTASFDHRVIDGAYGAKFLAKFKDLVEHPNLMLI